jgi:ABC-2 type transport system ATP-binding protein
LGAEVLEGTVRIAQAEGHLLIAKLVEAFPEQIRSIRLGKPSLEDVFIARTGHRFWSEETGSEEPTHV